MAKKVPVDQLCDLVDELASLNAKIKALSDKADSIKSVLKASGYDVILGKKHKAVVVSREQMRLDSKALALLVGADKIAQCSYPSQSVSVSLYDL